MTSESGRYHIYLLRDPRTMDVRYVGVTTDPKSRFSGHIAASKNTNNRDPKNIWFRNMMQSGVTPVMEVSETVDRPLRKKAEALCIQKHSGSGMLLNRYLTKPDSARKKILTRLNIPVRRSLRNALNRSARSAGVPAKVHIVSIVAGYLGKK